jgi:hypothetical protein
MDDSEYPGEDFLGEARRQEAPILFTFNLIPTNHKNFLPPGISPKIEYKLYRYPPGLTFVRSTVLCYFSRGAPVYVEAFV